VPPRRMTAWSPQYANKHIQQRQGYQSGRYRPYQSATTQPQRPAYGTQRVNYAFNRR